MSGVWLSRTLPHLMVSELADAGGKSEQYPNAWPSLPRFQIGVTFRGDSLALGELLGVISGADFLEGLLVPLG